MKCKKCLSEWKSDLDVDKCPFCGADLNEEKSLKEIATIPQALNYIIAKHGNDILLKPRVVISYISDLVMGQDRTKKLFRKGCDERVLEKVYAILLEPKKNRQEIMVLDLKSSLVEDAFFSEQSAVKLLQIILEGVGLPHYVAIISRNSPDRTKTQSVKQPSALPPILHKNIQLGGKVQFGQYPQGANGEVQPLVWRVIAVENGRALLITDKLIDAMPYNKEDFKVTWETCTLRKWMNNDFISKAFKSNQLAQIVTVTNQNPKNPQYGTKGGNATQDRIFALSIDEANKYFRDDDDSMAAPTGYAKKQGCYVSSDYLLPSGEKTGWWWLRSPGNYSDLAARVGLDGYIFRRGDCVSRSDVAVRPAFWLNL